MSVESTKAVGLPARAPGPVGLPFFGSVFEAWKNPIDLLMRTHREHGDVAEMKMGPYRFFLVNDPAAIRHVLVDNPANYTKSRNYDGLKLLLGTGLLTSEGDFWRRQRKLAQPAFHRERLAGFADTMVRDTSAMLARWQSLPPGEVDVHDEMMRLTLRIVGKTLFGVDVDGDAKEVGKALSVLIHYANDYVESVVRTPQWLPTPANVRFREAAQTVDRLVMRIIEERRRAEVDVPDLLGMLMAVRDEETQERMSDRQLRDEVTTLVLAGHETTANALTWAWYLLSKHPDVARALRREVTDVLQGRDPTFADLPRLRYTSMVVNEAMRLYPPAWVFERQAKASDEVGGFVVPKGAIVAISPYALHRHPAYWENPEGFDPERFLPEAVEKRPRYTYLPFGAGPRTCIGNGFALMEAQLIVAMVAARFRLELVPGHPVEIDPSITLRPKQGVLVTLRRVGDSNRENGR